MASPQRIGIDLDGVIIDHSEHKRQLAAKYGFTLEPWQTNINVMPNFVKQSFYDKLQEILYTDMTPKAPPVKGALETLSTLPGEFYIVSARKHSSVRYAQDWMIQHRIYDVIPAERIFFCGGVAEKKGYCDRLGIRVFMDDKLKTLQTLPPATKRVFFDEYSLSSKLDCGHGTHIVKSWQGFKDLLAAE